jgi:hypothetical protein
MAVQDDPAWKEWSKAYDQFQVALNLFAEVRNLPENHVNRQAAAQALGLALVALNVAAAKIGLHID